MKPKTDSKNYRIIRSLIVNLFLVIMICSMKIYAQQQTDSSSDKNALSVNIENINIQGDSLIHGLIPNFPYPVISTITIFDSAGDFVTDLADTARWLAPEDIAQIGLPISQIWHPIVEYHADNASIPDDPNLYHQIPEPLFKEVLKDMHVPTSTMLVMDASTSMSEKLEDAKAGARLYVEQLRPVDRAGILLFNHEVVKLQKFTSDKNLLFNTIDSASTDFGTAINDALMAAIQETKLEKSRPRIIAYTDGVDNNSVTRPQAIIDSARVYNIPIYTISIKLDDYTVEDTLKQIADMTGGLFFRIKSAQEIPSIYQQLADLIKHFYLMAHASPDPIRNNTWRKVDVTVNLPEKLGNYQLRGVGRYFVPGRLPADLSVDLVSLTDNNIIEANDTLNAVKPGDIYQYQIQVINNGPNETNYVKISHIIPDSVQLIGTTIQPFMIKDSLIVWQFNHLGAEDEINIGVTVQLPNPISTDLKKLVSSVELIAPNDYNPENNRDQDTVLVFFPQPSKNYDLSISQFASTDSIAVVENDTIQVVFAKGIIHYTLAVENLGKTTAKNFTVLDVLPDSVSVHDYDFQPTKLTADTMFWQIDSLPVGQILKISFYSEVADTLSSDLFPLTNISEVIADQDTFLQNNSATTTVYGILRPEHQPQPLQYDLSISQVAIADSVLETGTDSIQIVLCGNTVDYKLAVENLGPGTARNFTVWDELPDSASFSNYTICPSLQIADTLFWRVDSLAAGDILNISFQAEIADSFESYPFPLVNSSGVMAAEDTNDQNNFATTTVYAISKPDSQVITEIDISVSQAAKTDSFFVVENDTMRFARPGEIYSYTITISNNSTATAESVHLTDQLPDSVRAVNFKQMPDLLTNDSLVWELGDLPAGTSFRLNFDVIVPSKMPIGINKLINRVAAFAQNENSELLTNNIAVDTVYNVVKPAEGMSPIITANPPIVDIGEEISIRVQVLVPIQSWDIWVYLADGSVDYSFADQFILNNKLEPDRWYDIDPRYKNTKFYTSAEQEQIMFELRTIDIFGAVQTAQAYVTVRSNNVFYLDRNVFEAQRLEPLGIHFKLSSNRVACLDLFDISGKKIVTLTEEPYQAGWNTFNWNGMLDDGLKIGSGLYLITLKSGNFNDVKKVMIVQ